MQLQESYQPYNEDLSQTPPVPQTGEWPTWVGIYSPINKRMSLWRETGQYNQLLVTYSVSYNVVLSVGE